MAGVDGLDVCRYLKTQANTQSVPVIMLSASPDIGKLAQSCGAQDALEKPFKMKALKEMVERWVYAQQN